MKNVRIWLLILAALAIALPLAAQDTNASTPQTANITGTVTDVNGDTLSGATVVLQGPGLRDPRKVLSDDNGFFEFKQLDPGTYRVTITAQEFADWTSPDLVLNAGQYLILTDSKLRIAKATTTVSVVYTPVEVATDARRPAAMSSWAWIARGASSPITTTTPTVLGLMRPPVRVPDPRGASRGPLFPGACAATRP